jgi:hypothetical protein
MRSPRRSGISLNHFSWTEEIRKTGNPFSSAQVTNPRLSTCLIVL